ncbi:hypothetical protein LCGC14_1789360 [marine sediment metagenome]|uniref:FMN-binding domain-containing protein n=1 Tax=marine sediment metagenome TaxID=412755 RepID=A0A0F9GT21_9ZZZZ
MDKNVIKILVVLSLIAVAVALVLANVYTVTSPLIAANKKAVIKKAVTQVLPDAKNYEQKRVNGITVFVGKDDSGETVGYAFIAEGAGYAGNISIMAGADKKLSELRGLYVMEQLETPGLGNRIAEDRFQDQFKGVKISPQIEYVKNKKPSKDNEIQAITGATISSKAVVDNLNKSIARIKKDL